MAERLAFCTFGMFIIDEIEYINGKAPEQKIIGGAGTYAAIGARLASGGFHADRVSWIVDMGSDFPPEFQVLINSWQTTCLFRFDPGRLTTRAWNGYGPNEYRAFKYLTPKMRLDENSLSDDQVLSRSFHMVCSPQRCISLVNGVMDRRQRLAPEERRPIFVWEPVPDLCTPEEFHALWRAAALVDVVSPNADEFAAFFSPTVDETDRMAMVRTRLRPDPGQPSGPVLVIREGAAGCTIYTGHLTLHLSAYHQELTRVVDPTGGGNTFLGALAMAMTGLVHPPAHETEREIGTNWECSLPSELAAHHLLPGLLHATIAASFVIEQSGTPVLSENDPDGWNGEGYEHRFRAYLAREKGHILDQMRAMA